MDSDLPTCYLLTTYIIQRACTTNMKTYTSNVQKKTPQHPLSEKTQQEEKEKQKPKKRFVVAMRYTQVNLVYSHGE
jgi:hypothetical protein